MSGQGRGAPSTQPDPSGLLRPNSHLKHFKALLPSTLSSLVEQQTLQAAPGTALLL